MPFTSWVLGGSDLIILPIFLFCSWVLFHYIYNLFIHPLAHIPGPFLARISPWPSAYHAWKGDRHLWLENYFHKYGNKLRVAPDTVIFRNPTAYRDIHGSRSNVRKAEFYEALKREDTQTSTITYTDNAAHARSRRLLDLAFTSKSLRASTEFMQRHTDRWHELLAAEGGDDWTQPFNFTERVNWLVFDILGDIAYGASFKTIEPEENLLKAVPRAAVKTMAVLYGIAKSPFLKFYLYLRPRGLSRLFVALRPAQVVLFDNFVVSSIKQRVEHEKQSEALGGSREDMFHFIYNAKDDETGEAAFRDHALMAECRLLVIAGSDSSAVTLASLFFHLAYYPETLDKLRQEITSTFVCAEDILPGPGLSSCKYLRAVIDESLRLAPTGLSELPRQVLPGGAVIDGEYFPENTIVGTANWCDAFNDEVYGDAAVFRPERWLVDDKNSADDVKRIKANFHPFSFGPHGCAGTTFALQELSLMVAKTVHRFEFRVPPEWAKFEGVPYRRVGDKKVPHFELRDAYITARDGPVMLQFRKRHV